MAWKVNFDLHLTFIPSNCSAQCHYRSTDLLFCFCVEHTVQTHIQRLVHKHFTQCTHTHTNSSASPSNRHISVHVLFIICSQVPKGLREDKLSSLSSSFQCTVFVKTQKHCTLIFYLHFLLYLASLSSKATYMISKIWSTCSRKNIYGYFQSVHKRQIPRLYFTLQLHISLCNYVQPTRTCAS